MNFLKSGAIYAVANIASAALPFLLLPLLTRVLGPAEYGQVIGFALLVTMCGTVAGLNVHAAMGVIWFQKPAEEIPAYTGSALGLAFMSAAFIAPIVMLLMWSFPGVAGLDPVWGLIAAFTAASNVMLQTRLVLWQSQHKAIPSAALQFAASLLNLTLSLVAVLLLHWGAEGRNGAIAASGGLMAATAVLLFLTSGEVRWQPRREHLSTLVRFGAPLIAHSFAAVLLSTADRWMVSIKLDAAALGLYGAGAQLGMIMTILGDAFIKAYGPWLYGKLKGEDENDRLCAVGAVYAAMPLFLAIAAGLGVFLFFTAGMILGPRYQEAAVVLPWFMLGGAFSGVYLCTSALFFFSGRTGLLATVTMSSGLTGLVLTWALVSAFGMMGAAMGFASTQILLGVSTTIVAMASFDLPWFQPRAALRIWSQHLLAPISGHSRPIDEKDPPS